MTGLRKTVKTKRRGFVRRAGVAIASLSAAGMLASASAKESEVREESANMDAAIRAFLMDNPETIIRAIESIAGPGGSFEDAQRVLFIVENRDEIIEGPSIGPSDGDVVVEWFDYNCGFCRRNAADVVEWAENHRVRLVFKEYPILGDREPGSVESAKAALAAEQQDAYLEFHLAMMKTEGRAGKERALAIAKDLGLDLDQFRRDMASPAIESVIMENLWLGRQLGVSGTPSVLVEGRIVRGWQPAEVDRLLASTVSLPCVGDYCD